MKSTIGLDIGSHSIKLVEMSFDKDIYTLVSAGSVPTPPKALSSSLPADQQAIAATIKKLIADSGVKSESVNIALPESQVFTRVIQVPQLSQRELTSAIKWEAEQYIPLPLDQVNVDFTVLRDSKETGTNTMDVLLVAGPKALIEKYVTILEMAELVPLIVETEIISSSRALVKSVAGVRTVMIISLGAQTTDLAILRGGVIAFTRSISAGGEALSRALAQSLNFEVAQAEEYKKAYGLEVDKLEGKLVAAVKPIMETIITEVKRAISFYQEKYHEEKIETIILSGGSAKMPGMVVYIAQAVGIEAQLANPWIGVAKDLRFNVLETEGPVYSVACGLALRQ